MKNANENDHLLTQQQAAEYLGLTPRFLEMRRFNGNGLASTTSNSSAVMTRRSPSTCSGIRRTVAGCPRGKTDSSGSTDEQRTRHA